MIKIDDEFKNLIPPLTDDEYKGLEESILKEGCRDSLVTWNDILIDGHNRYEICVKHGIAFQTTEKDFKSRDEVLLWMINNQKSRRNLTAFAKGTLESKAIEILSKRAKEKRLSTLKQNADNRLCEFTQTEKEEKTIETPKIDVKKELAKRIGTGEQTASRIMNINKHIEKAIEENKTIAGQKPEEIKQKLMTGDVSINEAYNKIKLEEKKETSTPKAIVQEVLKRPHVSFNSGNNEWYTPKEYIEAAYKTMGVINLDPASNEIANKVVKAEKYYTADENGLEKAWNGNIWLNPPYSSDLIGKFADKLLSERKNYTQAIVLVNNATETEWFNKIVSISSAVCFPKGRVKFYTPDGKTGQPLQGQAVLYIGDNPNEFINAFAGFGWRTVLHGVSKQ